MIRFTGFKVVREFLESPYQRLHAVYMDGERRHPHAGSLKLLAERRNVSFREVSRTHLKDVAGEEEVRGGVVGVLKEYRYFSLEEVVVDEVRDLAVVLDRIYDPHNLGAIARSAYCFRASFMIIQSHRAANIRRAAIQASAGTLAKIPVVLVSNVAKSLDFLKNAGFWVYGASAGGDTPLGELSIEGKIAVVVGSEGSGMREHVRKRCDFMVRIPMREDFDSLNVSVAAGIFLYHVFLKMGDCS